MAEQSKVEAHRVGRTRYRIALFFFPIFARQSSVPVASNELWSQSRKGIAAEAFGEWLRVALIRSLTHRSFRWRDIGQISLQSVRHRHSISSSALEVGTPNHLVFGPTGPVLSIALRAEGPRGRGPSGLSDESFPCA